MENIFCQNYYQEILKITKICLFIYIRKTGKYSFSKQTSQTEAIRYQLSNDSDDEYKY
jgi:hypothetical protein